MGGKVALIIVLQNISDLAEVSSYQYKVLVGDGTPDRSRTISSGQIDNHRRTDGWEALVRRLPGVDTRPLPVPDSPEPSDGGGS